MRENVPEQLYRDLVRTARRMIDEGSDSGWASIYQEAIDAGASSEEATRKVAGELLAAFEAGHGAILQGASSQR